MKLLVVTCLTLLMIAVSVEGLRIIRPPGKCPPLCRNLCPNGRVLDSRGCPTCRCKPSRPGYCSRICRGFCLLSRRPSSSCRTCKCQKQTTCSKLLCNLCETPYGRRNRRCRSCRC